MPTIPELLFHQNELETICRQQLDYFRNLEMIHPYEDEKIKLKEVSWVDLDFSHQDTIHRDKQDVSSSKDIYFVNCLFANNEKLSINRFDGYNLHFYNCVFFNRIDLVCCPNEMFFDKCVFVEGVGLRLALYENMKSIEISQSSLTKIDIYDGEINSLSISSCYCDRLLLDEIKAENIFIYLCVINKLSLNKIICPRINFDPYQIKSLNKLFISARDFRTIVDHSKKTQGSLIQNLKMFFSIKNKQNYEYQLSRINTLEFLRTKTLLRYSFFLRSKIDYVKQGILYETSHFRLFMWLFGYFLKPLKIAYLSIFTILYFGILYAGDIQLLSSLNPNLGLLDCIYFSGVTFFTIGYGDMTPLGYLKLLVLLEGFLGVLMSGLFVVVFTRNFISE